MILSVVFHCEWVKDHLRAFLGLVSHPMDGSMNASVLSPSGIKDSFVIFVDASCKDRVDAFDFVLCSWMILLIFLLCHMVFTISIPPCCPWR